jgi:hypothetical protein
MNSQKIEIPANPTARDKGNAPPSAAPGLTFEETVTAAETLGATGDVPAQTRDFLTNLASPPANEPRDHEPEPGVFVTSEPKEGSDGRKRR